MKKINLWQPFIFSVLIAIGIFIGLQLKNSGGIVENIFSNRTEQFNKLNNVINYINKEYVDTVNQKKLVESTITDMLHQLDPHSIYIPAEDLQAVNEPLQGNFEGIGIEFHIQEDTIMVVNAVVGGPSEQLGIKAGDRIVKVDGKNVSGIHITNQQVLQMLRGEGGTRVQVSIRRNNGSKLVDYTITRGRIPIFSVDVGYMINDTVGYIKISQFAAKTYEEYLDKFLFLKEKGMKDLIIDLRGNGGGYLNTARQIADEFLPDKKLIVYTKGRSKPTESLEATSRGFFEKGKLVVLIDEGSASASEILAGALQDWDRATIVGRRSFGKGLVQEQSEFPDGSAMRLTVARYYTPSGRSIQKPYTDGYDAYEEEIMKRFKNKEFSSIDSVHFSDSLKYKTASGRIVYGGGGIMPDVFVPLDTSNVTPWYESVNNQGLVNEFAYNYLDQHRTDFSKYKSSDDFNKNFEVNDKILEELIQFAEKNKVKRNAEEEKISSGIISIQLKALIARQLYKNDGFYPVIHQIDRTLQQAILQFAK